MRGSRPQAATPVSPALRLYRAHHAALRNAYALLLGGHGLARAVTAGVWLGLLERDQLLAVGDAFYASHPRYADDAYTRSGLQPWERAAVRQHFPERGRLLLVGAGAGREVLALAGLGYEVVGYECNRALVAQGARHLGADVHARLAWAPPDTCPPAGGTFDGLIVGWGAYMLVYGRARRVALLRAMRAQATPGAPLLLSFFVRDAASRRYPVIRAIANALRRVRGRELVETGDDLEPEYVHAFTRDELHAELAEAGFELRAFSDMPYGHAVARAAGPHGPASRPRPGASATTPTPGDRTPPAFPAPSPPR